MDEDCLLLCDALSSRGAAAVILRGISHVLTALPSVLIRAGGPVRKPKLRQSSDAIPSFAILAPGSHSMPSG